MDMDEPDWKHLAVVIGKEYFFYRHDPEGLMTYVSPSIRDMLGYEPADYLRHYSSCMTDAPANADVSRRTELGLQGKRQPPYEVEVRHKDGSARWLEVTEYPLYDPAGAIIGLEGIARNISERKQQQVYRRIAQRILEILNEPGDIRASIQRAILEFKAGTGFDAVGIRLQAGEDFPYTASAGMPEDFLLTENTLIERGPDDAPCRDEHGAAKLACTCGMVLAARPGDANPFLTPSGSFWTNDSAPPLDVPAEEDPRHHPRNRCIHLGYASVALVPIRSEDRIVGLVHINDRRAGRFAPETIALLEELAANIGSALRRKHLEAALQTSEHRFRELFDQAPLGVALIDSHTGRMKELNPMFARIAGRSVEEMRRADWMSITHPDDTQKDLDQMARMNAGEIPGFQMEKRYLRPDGSVVWIDMTISPLKIEEDAPPHHLCMIQDITERKKTEEALSESQKLSEGIINAITDEVWFADSGKKFRLMNRAAVRNFPADKPVDVEELARSLEVFRPDGSPRPVEEAPPLRALAGQTVINQEEIVRLPVSGELRHRQVCAAPVRDAQGRIIGSVSIVRDITRQKQSDSALSSMQKLESLGTLAGGIAHDFNNILTAILGNLSLLETKLVGGEEPLALIKEAQDACGTAKSLSNELLTFSKGGAPVVEVMDLRPVLTQAAVFASRGTKTRCVFNLGEAPLMVTIDKDLISRVIQNLVVNATQAMPKGGDFTVDAEIVDHGESMTPPRAAGRFVRLTVQDQGAGIKPEALARIFDPYFSTKGSGRGLGLSICYSIMAKHGGNISTALRPAAGAVFLLHLPCADPAYAAEAPAGREKAGLKPREGKVLIMDDDASLARVLKRMVEHLGCAADAATNGRDALEAYRREMTAGKPYDAVILDLTVTGGMGGLEMIGALLALDPAARAIVSSGYANDSVMAEFARHGFAGRLAKPYNIEQVSAALCRVLGRS